MRSSPHFKKILGRRRGLGAARPKKAAPLLGEKLESIAAAGSSLSLPWSLLHPVFITMGGGKDASDKYHKSETIQEKRARMIVEEGSEAIAASREKGGAGFKPAPTVHIWWAVPTLHVT
jgi:acid phosphatase class B